MIAAHTKFTSQTHLFRRLAAFWILLFGATLVFALVILPVKPAKALEQLPFPKVSREIAPAQIFPFTVAQAADLATDAKNSDRCGAYLPTRSEKAAPGTSGLFVQVNAIKAYRQCKSKTALQELAMTWRWSR